MAVQVVTDSGSDLPPDLAARHGISVVPLHVSMGGKEYRDGVELQPDRFYELMKQYPDLPQTSTPSPQEMAEAYRRAGQEGAVLGLHLSSALSGTYQTAVIASRGMEQVSVIDSLNGSSGQALLALEAAEKARVGASLSELSAWVRLLVRRVRTLALVDRLENAVKGGRISRVAGLAAEVLDIKPLLHVTDAGKVEQLEKIRGRRKALRRMVELAEAEGVPGRLIVIGHALSPEDADYLTGEVRKRLEPKEVVVVPMGATIGTYAGQGAITLSYQRA